MGDAILEYDRVRIQRHERDRGVHEDITTTNMLVRLASVTMLRVKEKERVAKNKQGVSLFYVATRAPKACCCV